MKASIGDRIVVVSAQVGAPVREGVVVELRRDDGSPPYVVEWLDNGQRGLYFPGADGRIEHATVPEAGSDAHGQAEAPEVVTPHVKTWTVTVQVFEQGPATSARAVLHAESATALEARGSARRNPGDPDVPEIGDEVAVARALRHLADTLMSAAQDDMTAVSRFSDAP